MDLILAYLAGLLTLINPCVLPILPIVLATALQAGRGGPLALAGGLSLSFVALGIGLSVLGRASGLTPELLARIAAFLMAGFGLVLLFPQAQTAFAGLTAGLSARADRRLDDLDRSRLSGQFLAGLLLGAVWVPCIGPTLGGAIALAAAGEQLMWAAAIMVAFALGTSTIILGLGYGAQSAMRRWRDRLRGWAGHVRVATGVIFLATGLALAFDLHKYAEIWLLGALPPWLLDLSVRF